MPENENYSALKVPELRALLRRRGLAVSGVKATLVERLTAAAPAATQHHEATTNGAEHRRPRPTAKRARKKGAPAQAPSAPECLPRTRELQLLAKEPGTDLAVIGVDEAGRGPLAGPVVAAAAIVPTNVAGIIDSKKITKECERERIYEELIASPGVRYAVAVISAERIDEINILQATMEGMRRAVEALVTADPDAREATGTQGNAASAERQGSYVITGGGTAGKARRSGENDAAGGGFYALVDGNRTPADMPCPCEALVKGDGREYAIGAASILAKVTRDRLMREYDKKYPAFNLSQHKGYGTAAHMSAIQEFGASPIHRRTFAPLKHMEFDDEGKVIG